MSLFIDDGYTLEGTVRARPGIHPELTFTFRPALSEKVHRLAQIVGRGGDDAFKARLTFVLDHLVSWSAKGKDGTEVPRSEASLRRLRYQVLTDMADIVSGYMASGESEADAKN